MKRGILVVIGIAILGLALLTGCSDSGGGGGGLPRSEALYEGPQLPAVIDSSTNWIYWDISWYIYNEVFFFSATSSSLAATYSNVGETETVGSISGSYLDWWDEQGFASTTEEWQKSIWGRNYNDYRNSTGVLRGEGSFYDSYNTRRTTDGVSVPLVLGAIGQTLTQEYSCHCNNSAYMESTASTAILQGGWMTQNGHSTYDTTDGTWTWTQAGRANYGNNNLTEDKYWAVFGANASMAYDGSQNAFTASGIYCMEGIGWRFEGCVDFDYDLTFACEVPWECSPAGTQTVSTDTASAKFTFDGNWCYDYEIDIGKNGSVDSTGHFCD